MARIGFAGLGHMGLPMALNLMKAGHQVEGYDRQAEAMVAFKVAGGMTAVSLKDLALDKDVIVTMLQTGEQVKQVCLGEEGLYTLVGKALHIDCSSIDVASSRELHRQALAHQLSCVDAPVSGGVAGAKAGRLTFMVGGEEAAFQQAKPLLLVMGKNIYHSGAAGSGQAAKICNNMILGISMIAISEAFVLAEQLGLAAEKLAEVVNHASGQCWAMTNYAPVPGLLPDAPASHDYQPGFTAAMMLKDLLLSQDAASTSHIKTRLGEEATGVYQRFKDQGFGELDFSAIIKAVRQDNERISESEHGTPFDDPLPPVVHHR